ncbi:MAG: murein biosynthesis integral membrane protein MurJ [Burkholderiaceae bacterium]
MNLFRSAALVSAMTFVSRIAGLIRENLIASIFGAGAFTDAFFVAFRLPNLLRRMFAEGAFSQAFVPLLAAARRDQQMPNELIDRVATALFWVVSAVAALGVIAAPTLLWLIASGLAREPAAFDAGVLMTRIMFPYIALISLVSLCGGILNTWQRFAVPALTPVLLNLAIIAAALWLAPHVEPPIVALAVGVMVGGIAQLAIQVPALRRLGLLPRIGLSARAALADPSTRRIMALMAPGILAVSAQQISLLINTHIASRLTVGSVSWISFGDRLMEFPQGLLGVALGTVLLPSLSAAVATDDDAEYSLLLDWGLRLAVVLALPCALAMMLMPEPLTALLYHYGRFSTHDVEMTALAVQAYAPGLLGFVAVKVLAPGFFARQNVRTPVKIAIGAMLLTQALNLVLVPRFAHAGLALSISLAALANAGLLGWLLVRGGRFRPAPGWGRFLLRVAIGLAALTAVIEFWLLHFDWAAMQSSPVWRALEVLAIVAAGAAAYGIGLTLAGLRPWTLTRRPRR